MRITGNTVFIAGATSGIGLALALALQVRANKVIVGGRRTKLLAQIAAEHPEIDTVQIDTADADSVRAAAEQVLQRHRDLNVVITMAGVMNIEDWHHPDLFLASAESVITTNVLGPIRLIAAFTEHLQKQPQSTIVTVSSGIAFVPLMATPSYNASKAAIHMLTESLRLQLADTTIELKELVPPLVQTDLVPGLRDSSAAMLLEDYVDDVVRLMENEPDDKEIQGELVKRLRDSQGEGQYDQAIAAVNSTDPEVFAISRIRSHKRVAAQAQRH